MQDDDFHAVHAGFKQWLRIEQFKEERDRLKQEVAHLSKGLDRYLGERSVERDKAFDAYGRVYKRYLRAKDLYEIAQDDGPDAALLAKLAQD